MTNECMDAGERERIADYVVSRDGIERDCDWPQDLLFKMPDGLCVFCGDPLDSLPHKYVLGSFLCPDR